MRRFKIFKYILISVTAFILITAASAALFIYFFPEEKVLGILTSKAEQTLKRKIVIKKIEYSLRGVMVKNVILYDGLTDTDPIIARAREARVGFSLYALLDKRLDIDHITLNSLKLNIRFKDGTSNIERLLQDIKKQSKSTQTTTTTSISSISLNRAIISLSEPPDYLKGLKGTYQVTTLLNLQKGQDLSIRNATILLPEKRGTIYTNLKFNRKKSGFKLKGNVRLVKCSLLWIYKWKNISLPYSAVSVRVKNFILTRNNVQGDVEGTSHLSSGKTLQINGSCKVTIPNRTVHISNTKARIQNSNVMLNNILFTFDGKAINFRTTEAYFALNDLSSILTSFPRQLYGVVCGNLAYENNKYNGELILKNVGFNRAQKIISDLNGTVAIVNNEFKKKDLNVSILNQPFHLSIATKDFKSKQLYINLSAKKFEINQEKKSGTGFETRLNFPLDIFGNIDIKNLRVNTLNLSDVSMTYTLYKNNLILNRFDCKLFGGLINGKGNINMKRNLPDLEFTIFFNGIKIQNISKFSKTFKKRVFGVANGKANFGFSIDKNSNIFKSLKGKVEFTIDKGKVVNTGIQNGLGLLLSQLKYKLRDLEFQKVYGNFNIIGSNFYINSFIFQAPEIRFAINGYVNKLLEGDLKISLEFTKSFIQDLPDPLAFIRSIGLNKYKKGGWYIIPFQAKGKDISKSSNIKLIK